MKKALLLAAALTVSTLGGSIGAKAEGFKSGVSVRSGDIGESTSLSGFVFKPLTSHEDGNLFYVDAYGSIIYDDSFENDVSVAVSSRLGFRSQKENGFGLNAGVDVTPYGDETFAQIGFGAEYFTEKLRLDLTGAIPFEEGNFDSYASGFISDGKLKLNSQTSKSTLSNYQLRGEYKVNTDTSLIAKVYALDPLKDNYDTEVGFGAGAKFNKGNTSLTVEYSYDEFFDSTVSANLSISLGDNSGDSKGSNERLLAYRSGQVKVGDVKRTFSATDAIASSSGVAVEALCIGSLGGSNSCSTTLNSTAISSNPDYILVANGTTTDLDLETTVADTLKLGADTTLTSVAEAPNIKTTLGTVKLSKFGSTSGAKPKFKDGTLSIASNTSIKGFDFENASITNYSTSNVTVANNTFTGSVDGNGPINFDGATDVLIQGNTITTPTATNPGTFFTDTDGDDVQDTGEAAIASFIGRGISVKDGNNVRILSNTVANATGEGIYIENIGTSSSNLVKSNTVTGMRASLDTNLEGGIFVRNDKDGYIQIDRNTVKDNNLTSGTGFPASRGGNSTDGIELNLCRGGVHTSKEVDFADGRVGACSSNATLTALITNNTITDLKGGADGIDTNFGSKGYLDLTVTGNTITGVGDEAFTLDAFAEARGGNIVISNNTLKSGGWKGQLAGEDGSTDGIAVTLHGHNDYETSNTSYTASSDYDFTIKNNVIEADTENIAGTVEKADKAEGIKFTISEELPAGTVKLEAAIENNTIQTRVGDGIEFAVNEKTDGVTFVGDILIKGNTITQTGSATDGDETGGILSEAKPAIGAVFGEKTGTTTAKVSWDIQDNTIITTNTKKAAIYFEYIDSAAGNDIDYNIVGNILTNAAAGSKGDIYLEIPADQAFGIVGSGTITDYSAYIQELNTDATVNIDGGSASTISSLTDQVTD